MHPVVSAPREGVVSDITFSNCRFEIDPAGTNAYRNGGIVGFAVYQQFNNCKHGDNVANLRHDNVVLK